MQEGSVLIYSGCRLGTPVALCAVEIQGGDAVVAIGTFEGSAAVQRFGGVISHSFILVSIPNDG